MFIINFGIWEYAQMAHIDPIWAIWAYDQIPKFIMNICLMGIYQKSTKIQTIWLKPDLIWTSGSGDIANFEILVFLPL